eukprot:7058501-Pyramimonas_sp.AAC.1
MHCDSPACLETAEEAEVFIHKVPEFIDDKPVNVELIQALSRAMRPCPGPDGTPYSGLARAGKFAADALNELYCHILDGGAIGPSFNEAFAVLLAKGGRAGS